jgi:hypothetical protein
MQGGCSVLEEQTQQQEMNRFEALCSEIGEYDHLPALTHDQVHPTRMVTGQDHHEAELDAEILAGLVSP